MATKRLHQPFANFHHLRSFLRGLLEPGDSFLGSSQPHFRIAQFAAQYRIVSGEPDGVAVGGAGLQQAAQVMERVSPEVLAEGAAAFVAARGVERGKSLVVPATIEIHHSLEQGSRGCLGSRARARSKQRNGSAGSREHSYSCRPSWIQAIASLGSS